MRVERFESVVDSPLPSGESDTSNDGRWVRARLIAEPDGTLGTEPHEFGDATGGHVERWLEDVAQRLLGEPE
jgi:hypothetical protein